MDTPLKRSDRERKSHFPMLRWNQMTMRHLRYKRRERPLPRVQLRIEQEDDEFVTCQISFKTAIRSAKDGRENPTLGTVATA